MIRPYRCPIMTRPAAWLAKNVPLRFTASVRSKSASVTFSARFSGAIPALLTRMSSRPNSSTVAATAGSIWSVRATSICSRSARRPRAATCSAIPPSAFASRKPRATWAPASASANAIARPRPRAAPVTRATWSRTSKRGSATSDIGFRLRSTADGRTSHTATASRSSSEIARASTRSATRLQFPQGRSFPARHTAGRRRRQSPSQIR